MFIMFCIILIINIYIELKYIVFYVYEIEKDYERVIRLEDS
jgi:hypothetical protein